MHLRRNRVIAMVALAAIVWSSTATSRAYENAAVQPASADPGMRRSEILEAVDSALAGQRLIQAKELLDRLENEPATSDNDGSELLRAEWLIAVGRPGEAIPLLAAADRGDGWHCRKLAAGMVALIQLSEFERADALAAAPAATCVADPLYWRGLGRLHLARDRARAAVSALRRATALDPGSDATIADLGVALIAAGEAAEARGILSALLVRHPGQPAARVNLDYANGMLGWRPSREASDSDLMWSERLQFAGLGARRANHLVLAEALLGQALIERPRHDDRLWREYLAIAERDQPGTGF